MVVQSNTTIQWPIKIERKPSKLTIKVKKQKVNITNYLINALQKKAKIAEINDERNIKIKGTKESHTTKENNERTSNRATH